MNKVNNTCMLRLLSVIMTLMVFNGFAVAQQKNNDQNNIIPVVMYKTAHFSGGYEEMVKWFHLRMRYPIQAEEQYIEGEVIVAFWVETDGCIRSARIIKSPHELLSKEALRIVKLMPPWTPGWENGKTVRQRITMPIVFKLTKNDAFDTKKNKI